VALNTTIAPTSDSLRLFDQTYQVALHRYHLGGEASLVDLRKLEIEIQTVQTEQRALEIERDGLRAELNALLNRGPRDPIGPVAMPMIRRNSMEEEELFRLAVERNPELAAWRSEIEARGAAQTLANLEKRPDFMTRAGFACAAGRHATHDSS
jgi:outer membrane protein TolC